MANKPFVFSVYDLEPVSNICEQILREVFRLPLVSIAHVTMSKGNVSLLHNHKITEESYFILEGDGILYRGNEAQEVPKGAFLNISKGVDHKLKNIGQSDLEHLVFAHPPFDPADVFLVEDNKKESRPVKYFSDRRSFSAMDGATVYEIDSSREREEKGFALAYGTLAPRRQALKHFHKISDEIYYVISGKGNVTLGNSVYPVIKGSVVLVPKQTVHGLENTEGAQLEVLCLSSPSYQDNDFILI